jgi:multisubunit Na+/H+ antiporter MnhF subunit
MLSDVLLVVIYISLILHTGMIALAVWRVWRGKNVVDRLLGVDLVGTLFLAVLVLLALISQRSIYIDVAIGLAMLGFIGTVALAKYVADEQMF